MTKFLNPTTSHLILVMAIIFGAIRDCLGSTLLTTDPGEISVDGSDAIYGLPTSVLIGYVSDEFGTAVDSSTTDKAWLEYTVTGGGTYYSGGSLAGIISTQFSIDLTRSVINPTVAGTIDVVLKVKLWYNNGGTDEQMDEVDYTFSVTVSGPGAGSSVISTATGVDTAGGFAADTVADDATGSGSVESTPPTIAVTHSGGQVAFGSPITLDVSVTAGTATIWVLTTDAITVSDNTDFGTGNLYEWPDVAVTSSTITETAAITTVNVDLKSVPVTVFNWGTVYVQLTVHFRETARRRALRGFQDGKYITTTRDESLAEQIVVMVTFAKDDSEDMLLSSLALNEAGDEMPFSSFAVHKSAADMTVPSLVAVSTTAIMTGIALLLV